MSRRPTAVEPPRLAAWLAVRRLAPEDREFALGDLNEEFRAIAARSPAAARRWYWREAVRAALVGRRPDVGSAPLKGGTMFGLVQDLRFAFRWLRRAPGFAFAAVGTLALGIGATTALFSVVYAVLFAQLPFPNASRVIVARDGDTRATSNPISFLQFREWRDSGVFDETAATFSWVPSFSGSGEPEMLDGLRASASLFDLLGVRPARGRAFTRADESREAAGVVLLGDAFWRRRFGAAGDAIGRTIRLSDVPYTVVGVLPASFRLRPGDQAYDVVAPLRLNDEVAPPSLRFLSATALLRPGDKNH